MSRLEGRTAIISGASSGIGQAIAHRLARAGANIVINYRGNRGGAEETLHHVEAAGSKGVIVQEDVSTADAGRRLVEAAWSAFGSADILVNNAGVEKKADFWEIPEADYDLVMNVNLRGPFFTTQAFVQRLKSAAKSGKVINISSVHEDLAFPGFTAYCCSKGALRMFTRTLSVELAPLGITINNVAPGAIETPINKALLADKAKLEALLNNIPVRRLGTSEEVADLVVYLASDEASYVTGTTFTIDGGLTKNYRE